MCRTAARCELKALEMSTAKVTREGEVKPLARHVNGDLAAIWVLDAELQVLKDGASVIRNEVSCDLVGETSDGLANGSRAK